MIHARAAHRRDTTESLPAFDVGQVRQDFPALQQSVNGHPLVYLDNAATAQKPRAVIEAVSRYYEQDNANIHRGVHTLSLRATDAYERARDKVRAFLGAGRREEIVFVRGTTEGMNLIAQTFGRSRLKAGDEVVITTLEHHSNIVPWQMLCGQVGATLRVAPINDDGELVLDEFTALLGPRTKLVSVAHISNALGTILPLREIVAQCRARGIGVVVDGAQAAPHMPIDVAALDCDFYVVSGHKMFAPTGSGVVYGRYEWLQQLPPWQGGGEMIKSVTFEGTTYNDVPHKFEAGTPDIAAVVGLGAAVDYLTHIGMDAIAAYEQDLLDYATRRLSELPAVRLIGTAREKAAVLSFLVEGVHAHDVGTILDQQGIAVRTGHHCAQPVMDRFGVPATVRASLAFYNTRADVDTLVAGLEQVAEVFGG